MVNSISKQILLLSLLWLVTLQGYAQGFTCGTSGGTGNPWGTATTLFTGNGSSQTPRGNLHILVIYTYDVNNPSYDQGFITEGWPVAPNPSDPDPLFRTTYTRIPTWAQNDGLLNNTVATIGSNPNNLSAYYKDMSQGQFLLTGYVFPAQVPCPYNGSLPDYDAALAWIEANKSIVAPGFSWAAFDQRTNNPNFAADNSVAPVPDSIIDYIVFFNRVYSPSGGAGEQKTMNSSINIPGTSYKGGVYHRCLPCAASLNQNFELFTHELSHGMVDMPHVMGANGTDGPYYYSAHGWGMMGHSNHVPFPGANAWEKWYWGWMQPQEITTSGTYTLGLLHNPAGADAIRIPVPGTNNTQYLWLEYHQPEYGMTVPHESPGKMGQTQNVFWTTKKCGTGHLRVCYCGSLEQPLHPCRL